jgi:hypothetical protein
MEAEKAGRRYPKPDPYAPSAGRHDLRPGFAALIFAILISILGAAAPLAEPAALAPEQARTIIAAETARAVRALKSRDMNELSKLVHPSKGVRFSPDAFLGENAGVRFTAPAIRGALADAKVRVWGAYDGSGKPIRLSFKDYYKRFVYDRDFAQAEVSYNGQPEHRSGSNDNSRERYPEAIIVGFFVPGPPGLEETGFRILRLVFEQYQGSWYLVHVIHDQWSV